MTRLFQRTRAATWPVLGLTIAAYSGACLFVSAVLFQDRIGRALGSLYTATGFLVQSALVGGLFSLAVTGIVVFGVGRCRGVDVGWRAGAVLTGMFVTFGFWLVMQGILAVVAAPHGQLAFNADWKQSDGGPVIGGVLGQLLGNALVEETVFRGFLLAQFYLKAAQRFRHGVALAIAVVGSSVLFALTHVPNLLLVKNMAGVDLLMFLGSLVGLGLFFAAIYLVTGNLFIAVGLHALVNTPVPLIHSSELTLGAVWFGLTVLLLIAWPRMKWLRADSDEKGDTMGREAD